MDTFRFRLNCIDHYQATPTDLDPQLRRGSGLSQRQNAPPVPVIRVFGATESGQKVCAHIHGALPYLYLEYHGSLEKDTVNSQIHQLRTSIDHALAISYRRNAYDGKAIYVGHVTLVKGVPFYGYRVGYKFFYKVYMLNPLHMTRLADLLVQGAIMNKILQPYESHLQYLLQWMCDYNLFGCAYIDCSKVKFRGPIPNYLEINSTSHKWHDRSIPEHFISDEGQFPRQSHCSIEVDVCVQDILNRKAVSQRPIHHDFIERFTHLGPDDKFVPSMAGLWKDETRRRKLRMGLTDPSSSPFPPEVLVSMSADPRNTAKGGWIHEDEYRELVERLIVEEKDKNERADLNFDTFVQATERERNVKTAVESVEDLFPENFLESEILFGEGESGSDQSHSITDGPTVAEHSKALHHTDELALGSEFEHSDDQYEEHIQRDGVIEEDFPDGQEDSDAQPVEDHPLQPLDEAIAGSELHAKSGSQDSDTVSANLQSISDIETSKKRSFTTDANVRKKRLRSSDSIQSQKDASSKAKTSTQKRVAFRDVLLDDGHSTEDSHPSQKSLGNGIPQASQSSQTSIKAHGVSGPSSFSFPVVKNPHAPETILRLSQTEYSNSQEAPETPASKQAWFNSSEPSPRTPWSHQKTSPLGTSSGSSVISAEARAVAAQFGEILCSSTKCCLYGHLPPSPEMIEATMIEAGVPPVIYQDAYYSDEADVPDRAREYAGREFRLESISLPYLPEFDPSGSSLASIGEDSAIVIDKAKEDVSNRIRQHRCGLRHWEIATAPPLRTEVEHWVLLEKEKYSTIESNKVGVKPDVRPVTKGLSQIEGPTQKNKHGFKYSQKQRSTSVKHETQYMSIMSLEVHVNTRGAFAPDPAEDEIACVFWCIQADENDSDVSGLRVGIIALSDEEGIARSIAKQTSVEVEYEEEELDLINRMVDIVREFDPDILTGYEVHNGSWGYLIERARMKYEYDLCDEISRMKSQSHGRFGKEADRWGFTHTSTIRVTGRHMINIWRAMRGELNLLQYTMENVVFHLLHKRIPHYSFEDLTQWFRSSKPRDLAKVIDYLLSRVQLNLEILELNEIVPRTSEQARLLGVDFFSVISRGSQFKVESTMFRIAKPENFILVSPSRKQVGQQNALECLPLVMEPQSAFYNSPLLVLDFQSLYPSVMIAYNFCYSTCLGRIVSWRGRNKMGFMDFKREPQLLELVKDYINIAPNGMMYVKPEMRKSLLAKMLGEILETRVMVKSGMKQDKDDKTLQQLLNNRQLALKLLANVTYGYTSASFSGRMPCSEIADSIVQTGRETLEKAIALIHSVERWGAEVVYGDTDSLFVYLKGRTRDQAFTIGEEIAQAVTKANPRPVKLKFEKVYHPCVLLAKKRYVGFKYESRTQEEPDFDAKGIETVRRDGTPAEQKIEEKALKLLFRTSDLSQVKRYFQSQCTKIMAGRVSIQDFLFAKEVKLGTYSDRGPPPPGALIATKRMLSDPRTEPQYGERVPYVVVTGAPGARLIDRCIAPEQLLQNEYLELDAEYYISKNLIPPLERIFNLVGANVRQWFDEMPKVQRIRNISVPLNKAETGNGSAMGGVQGAGGLRKTLESYMKSSACIVCHSKLPPNPYPPPVGEIDLKSLLPLCAMCLLRPARTLLTLRERLRDSETRAKQVDMVCRSCAGLPFGEEVKCDSRDCPVFYTRIRERARLGALKEGVGRVVDALESEVDEEGLEGDGAIASVSREELDW